MKLVFVNRFFHPDHSATSQLLSDLAFHLADQPGFEVVVVTSRQRYDDAAARLAAREVAQGAAIHRVWTTRFGRGRLPGRALDFVSFYMSAGCALLYLARRGDVIVAMTDPPLISVVAALVARLRGATLANWVQDAFPEVAAALGVQLPFPGALRSLRNRSLHAARANVVLGERMAEWARAQRVAPARVTVIPNWADGKAIRPLPHADNTLRREWGLAGMFVVGYSGNLGRAHEFATALAAAEQLRDQPDIVFLFIGGGYQHEALEAEARSRGLASVRCLPYQPRERLCESLGAADVHWISLRPELEGLIVPSKIYGVLAAGRPALMVGDPDGEVARLLRRSDCGISVEAGDGPAMARAILRLRDEPATREAMGRNARAAFDVHYSAERAFASWNHLLAKLPDD